MTLLMIMVIIRMRRSYHIVSEGRKELSSSQRQYVHRCVRVLCTRKVGAALDLIEK